MVLLICYNGSIVQWMNMQITILGANLVGKGLAQLLGHEGHDIVVVDESRQKLARIEEQIDVKTVVGRPSYPEVLMQAGIGNSDVLIAVTENDEVNMVACQVAHSLFGTRHKIARVNSPHYHVRDDLYGSDQLPIDVFINPERILSRSIRDLLKYNGTEEVVAFMKQQVAVSIISVADSFSADSDDIDVGQLYRFHSAQWQPVLLKDVKPGMQVMLVTYVDKMNAWLDLLAGRKKETKQIIVMGAGRVTSQLINRLGDLYHMKVIDVSKSRAINLATDYENVTVIHGDPTDRWLLNLEGIGDIDAFLALSDDDEDNLIACLQAKSLGVSRTMALTNHLSYASGFAQGLIDVILSPQQLIASQIVSSIYYQHFVRTRSFFRGQQVLFEWKIIAGSSWCGRRLADINQWRFVRVLALHHDENIELNDFDYVLRQGMSVVLLIEQDSVMKLIERLAR